MASSCVQLCLRCRSLHWAKTVPRAWQHCTQLQNSTKVIRVPTRIINVRSSVRRNYTTTNVGQIWKHQMLYHNDLTAKHLSTKATDDKYTEEQSKVNVVTYNSPLAPITDPNVTQNQIPVGMYCFSGFIIVDHIAILLQTYDL